MVGELSKLLMSSAQYWNVAYMSYKCRQASVHLLFYSDHLLGMCLAVNMMKHNKSW